jgi:peroxiredoxin
MMPAEELIPDFRLPEARGGRLGPWDFKQRRQLVVLFHHGLGCQECRAQLIEVAARHAEVLRHEAEVLALSPDPPEELARLADSLPFPLLSDRGGEVLRLYVPGDGSHLPVAFVADRYGALTEVFPPTGHRLDLDAVLRELEFNSYKCPECHIEDV